MNQETDIISPITDANADPMTPRLKLKIKIGLSIMLIIIPNSIPIIESVDAPSERTVSPTEKLAITNGAPITNIII
jgi:hypothetical protein